MNLFLADTLHAEGGTLGKEESHHASRVLRLSSGSQILTTRGNGVIYRSEIIEISKSSTGFKNLDVYKKEEAPPYLHIAIAPTKNNDRFEFFLEKATEIGISEITPVICDRSERKVYKTERGRKILDSASKQSLACWWPRLNEPVRFADLSAGEQDIEKFIAHCENEDMPNILKELSSYQKVLMLIGPEGDFSPAEISQARKRGFRECSLGKKRLRTETAGLAVALGFGMR